jgi:hypothetical protein
MDLAKRSSAKVFESQMLLNLSNNVFKEKGDVAVTPRRSSPSTRSSAKQGGRRGNSTSAPSHNYKRTYVEHIYHDHRNDAIGPLAQDSLDSLDSLDPLDSLSADHMQPKRQRGPRGGVAVAFPEKLHAMLNRMDEDSTSGIVSWQPHGRCFLIHKKKDFVGGVMPR